MSNIGLIIEERSRDIGDFLVGRLIPFRKKRMIGPFIFIDHMGPTKLGPEKYMDVDQHPHMGLSTLTFMLEGEINHEDSLGTHQRIKPGSVNWMTAGKGVTHTERTPQDLRNGNTFTAHGYQIWVALPKELEDMEPQFHHIDGEDIPKWTDGSTEFKLVAGEGYGKKSPVPVYSNLFMVEVMAKEAYSLNVNGNLKGEIGICIVEGGIEACGETVAVAQILWCSLGMGDPLPCRHPVNGTGFNTLMGPKAIFVVDLTFQHKCQSGKTHVRMLVHVHILFRS